MVRTLRCWYWLDARPWVLTKRFLVAVHVVRVARKLAHALTCETYHEALLREWGRF